MRRAPRGCASYSGAPALDQLARQMSVPARVAFLEDASDADRVIALEVGSYPVLGSAGSRVWWYPDDWGSRAVSPAGSARP